MDGKDRAEPATGQNSICSLEWIAWAMEAARRHMEDEQLGEPPEDDTHVGEED
jgi:hypothetical protein